MFYAFYLKIKMITSLTKRNIHKKNHKGIYQNSIKDFKKIIPF